MKKAAGRVAAILALPVALALALAASVAMPNVPPAWAGASPPRVAVAAQSQRAVHASPTVVRELRDKRTADSSTYLMSDGSFQAKICNDAIHYKDAKGAWQDIDVSLVPAESPGVVHTRASAYDETFASDGVSANPVTVKHGDWSMSMKLLGGEQSNPVALGDTDDFPLAMTDTQLKYQASAHALKDTLVLSSRNAPSTFTFFVSLKNLSLYSSPSGGYSFVDDKGKLAGWIDPLQVYDSATDAAGNPTSLCTGAKMTAVAVPGGAYITYTVPRAWLDDPARVYPVSIDPTYAFSTSCDTFVSSGNPTTKYRSEPDLEAGYVPTSGRNTCRSLITFAMDGITSGATITSAQLQMYCLEAVGSNAVHVDPVDGAWDYNATWNSTFASPAHISYDDAMGVALTVSSTGLKYWNGLGPAVQSWYDGSRPNYGLCIKDYPDSSSGKYCRFGSLEYTSVSCRPFLTVNYTLSTITSGSYDRVAYEPGDTVKAEVDVTSKLHPTDVEMKVLSGSTCRGHLIYTYDGTNHFSFDSSPGAGYVDGAMIPDPANSSASYDGSTCRVHFAYKIGDTYGDIQNNHLWALDHDWSSTPLTDMSTLSPSCSYSIVPSGTVPSAVTSASAGWFVIGDQDGDGISDGDDSNAGGRGAIDLTWQAAPGASRYSVYLYDGVGYEKVATTTALSWSSAAQGLYPSDSAIASMAAPTARPVYLLDKSGLDLRDDPADLYAKTRGDQAGGSTYYVKVAPSNSATEVPLSSVATVGVELEERTLDAIPTASLQLASGSQYKPPLVIITGWHDVQPEWAGHNIFPNQLNAGDDIFNPLASEMDPFYKIVKVPAEWEHLDPKIIRSNGDLSRNGDAAGKYLEANPVLRDSKGKWHNYSIIGYSMGGLVARSMLDGYASDYRHWDLRNHANGILTLDTPHEGADAADIVYKAEWDVIALAHPKWNKAKVDANCDSYFEHNDPAVLSMTTWHMKHFNASHRNQYLKKTIKISKKKSKTVKSTPRSYVRYGGRAWIHDWLAGEDVLTWRDGFIGYSSQLGSHLGYLDGPKGGVVGWTGVVHSRHLLPGGSFSLDDNNQVTHKNTAIVPGDDGGPSTNEIAQSEAAVIDDFNYPVTSSQNIWFSNGGPVTASVASASREIWSQGSFETTSMITPAQSTTSAPVQACTPFEVQLSSSSAVLSVRDVNGRIVPTSVVSTGYSDDITSATVDAPILAVDTTATGTYSVSVSSLDTSPVAASVVASDGPSLLTWTRNESYACGASVVVTASVVDSQNNTLSGQFELQSAEASTAMHDDGAYPDATAGDGIFSAVATVPADPGPAAFEVDAACVDGTERVDELQLNAYTPTVQCDETPQLSIPATGVVSTATVTANISSSVLQTGTVSCALYDCDGQLVGRPCVDATLVVGMNTVSIPIPHEALWQSLMSGSSDATGPATITDIYVSIDDTDTGQSQDIMDKSVHLVANLSPTRVDHRDASVEATFAAGDATTTVTLTGHAETNAQTVDRVQYSLDGGATWLDAYPQAGAFDSNAVDFEAKADLPDGEWEVLVRPWSGGCAWPDEDWAETCVRIDSSAPSVVASASVGATGTVVSVAANDGSGTAVASGVSDIVYTVDQGSIQVAPSVGVETSTTVPITSGIHTVTYAALDSAGNLSGWQSVTAVSP